MKSYFETTHNIKDLAAGVIALAIGAKMAWGALPACVLINESQWDAQGFQNSCSILEDPTKNFILLEDDLLINGVSILEDAKSAVTAYDNKDFVTYGQKIGQILKLTTATED
jgi:hypothetical protein